MGRGLSELQKTILRTLHESGADPIWGVPIPKSPEGWTRAQGAAYSRALLRLEKRGLLLRQNIAGWVPGFVRGSPIVPHVRTTHIILTEQGVETVNKMNDGIC